MKVEMEFKTNKKDLVEGFLFCTDKLDEINDYIIDNNTLTEKGEKLLLTNLVNTSDPHLQVMNQVQIKIKIFGITRALLQEFARHRIGNEMTVKSTRYTLNKICKDDRLGGITESNVCDIVNDYYYIPEIKNENTQNDINKFIYNRYTDLCYIANKKLHGWSNDNLKQYVNEYMLCNILTVMSGTALRNFLRKRLDNKAWYQIRNLAEEMYRQIPDDWKFLFKVYKYKKVDIDGRELYEKISLTDNL